MLIVHLSDIHFKVGDGDALDPNAELRRELGNDLRRLRTHLGRPFDVLTISGDIAFSGKAAEFVVARSWIKSLCELIDCPNTGVMVTPGNHDVDRDVINGSAELQTFHAEIRALPLAALDDRLAQTLRAPDSGERAFLPLAAYVQFASRYGCRCSRAMPWWEKTFPLGQGHKVTFRGVNTALISNHLDHRDTGKLVLGIVQCSLPRASGRINVVIGHHPPSWLRDQDAVERALAQRAALQLFGHRHEHWIDRLDNSVRLFAGAVQPDRQEANWFPRYNVIELGPIADGRLRILILPRRWYPEEGVFGPANDSQLRTTQELFHTLPRTDANVAGGASQGAEERGANQ